MTAKMHTYLKVIRANKAFVIGPIVTLATAVTTSFVWMQTDQVIAPPSLRVLDWLWRVFVCRCSV